MHANIAIWALLVLLPYSYGQDARDTTEATTDETTVTLTANIVGDGTSNTSANSESTNNTSIDDNSEVNNLTDSNLVGNTVNNNTSSNDNSDSVDTAIIVTTTGPTEPLNCTTARHIKGVCVHRRRCEYGTPGIDLTLFAPKWYKKPCQEVEVCCPFDSLVAYEPVIMYEDFEFKDDD